MERRKLKPYLCIDFGGTKLAVAIVDAASGAVTTEARVRTPAGEGASASVRLVLDACDELIAGSGVPASSLLGAGISFGGPVTADGTAVVRSMHVGAWDGVSLPELVSRRFGIPAAMENDANAAALAEATFGAGRGAASVFYVQVSTGIGAGLVLDGRVHRGARGGAGELGHVVVDPAGPECACGNRGCLEAVAAGWALARDARRIGAGSDAKDLVAAASRGDEAAGAIVAHAFSTLGAAVANAVSVLDPEVVIVGGGIAQSADVLLPPLRAALGTHVVAHLREPGRLVLSELGAQAPLIGAAVAAARRA